MASNINEEIQFLIKKKERLESSNWLVVLFTFGLKNNRAKIAMLDGQIADKKALSLRITSALASASRENRYKSEVNVTSNTRTSSNPVNCIFIEEGASYPSNWQELRKEILERDEKTCQEQDANCSGPLHVHHIIPLSRGGGNEPSNLITLCEYHHSLKHEHMQG